MTEKRPPEVLHPVCREHWQKLRQETLQGLPFWTRPFAGGTVDRMLHERGFAESTEACSFCQTNTDVDKVR